jgi:hypothetical protein
MKLGFVDPYYQTHPYLEVIQKWLSESFSKLNSLHDFERFVVPDFSDELIPIEPSPEISLINPKLITLTRHEFWDSKNNPTYCFLVPRMTKGDGFAVFKRFQSLFRSLIRWIST